MENAAPSKSQALLNKELKQKQRIEDRAKRAYKRLAKTLIKMIKQQQRIQARAARAQHRAAKAQHRLVKTLVKLINQKRRAMKKLIRQAGKKAVQTYHPVKYIMIGIPRDDIYSDEIQTSYVFRTEINGYRSDKYLLVVTKPLPKPSHKSSHKSSALAIEFNGEEEIEEDVIVRVPQSIFEELSIEEIEDDVIAKVPQSIFEELSTEEEEDVIVRVPQSIFEELSTEEEEDVIAKVPDSIVHELEIIKETEQSLPVVVQPLSEQITLEAELDTECDIHQVVDEEWIDDAEAQRLYIQELKNDNGSQVCGKQRKNFIRPAPLGNFGQNREEININTQSRMALIRAIIRGQYSKLKQFVLKYIAMTPDISAHRYQIIVSFANNHHSSKILDAEESVNNLLDKLKEISNRYQDMEQITGISIYRYKKRNGSNKLEQVRGGRHIMSMNKQYFVISPQTRTNCFYHCLVYYSLISKGEYAKITDQEKIVDSAKKLKTRTFDNNKTWADIEDLQAVADYYGSSFTVYDNLFRIKYIVKPKQQFTKGNKISPLVGAHIKLQFRNGHCLLLVSKSQHPHMVKYYEAIKKVLNYQQNAIFPKKPRVKNIRRHIWTYDIECIKKDKKSGEQVPFAIGLCTAYNTQTHQYTYKKFYGFDCVDKFLQYLADYKLEPIFLSKKDKKGNLKQQQQEVYLYAHNGAKYDISILNDKMMKFSGLSILKEKFMELNGGIINQVVHNDNDVTFVFRDSCRIFAGSLDELCRDLKPKHMKLKGKVVFNLWNSENVLGEYKDNISLYLKHDCLSLAEILVNFRDQLMNDPTTELDICDCFTSATMAKKLYFNKYYFKATFIQKKFGEKAVRVYIYELDRQTDLDIRDGYFGGRCDIYAYGKFRKVYYYDFTSLYPFVGSVEMMPIGKPARLDGSAIDKFFQFFKRSVEGSDIDIGNFFGFIRCRVTTNPNVLPLHGHKHNHKLTFANHIGTEIILFSEEIKMGLTLGNKYEFLYGYQFEQSPVLMQIMKDGFKRKETAKENGNPVMEKTWKILINSAYGFFGLRWMDKRGIKFLSEEQLDAYLEEGKVFNYNQINEKEFMVDMENDLYDIQGKSIAVAAAVTSYARMKLYSVMKDIIDHGKKIFYSDTDSIITDCNIKEFPDLMKKYQWDGCGKKMGSLKNECLDKIKSNVSKFINKNIILKCMVSKFQKQLIQEIVEKQTELDGGELYFDECQVLAPKVYSLKKTLLNGMEIQVVKSKGCKESSYEEQGKLLRGEIIKSTITQFRSGKGTYMNEEGRGFGKVFVTDVTKKISMYNDDEECKYSKGKIIGNDLKQIARISQLQKTMIGKCVYHFIKNQLYDALVVNENWEVRPHLFVAGVKQIE